jgi:DNA repair exonuclease SbcCD nuclease subunit
MPKFCLASDVHLGFGTTTINNTENADCLILAGDVYEFANLSPKSELSYNHIDMFFQHISEQFKQVVYIAGNHEYYGFQIDRGREHINRYLESMNFGNIKFLEKDSIDIDGVMVHAATMWTSFNNGDPVAMHQARYGMNDYRYISKDADTVLTPQIAYNEHMATMEFFKNAVSDGKKCVVVSHHAPLYKCIAPDHSHDALDHAYASDLSEFIMDNPNIAAWCFGHVHGRFDFMCGETRILSNCRGYAKYERIAETFEPFFFTV